MDSARTALRPLIDSRDAASVGRHARLELQFAYRRGRTVLAHGYAEPPFRVGRWFPDGDGVHMILASSGPGIFGGDRFDQLIGVERGARVRLTSQSALQVHPCRDDETAQLSAAYQVDDDAELVCEWDPMIPFARARFAQRVSVRLAPTARILWSDAFMAGRARARIPSRSEEGERWAFSELSHELKISREESLEYLERYRVIPAERSPESSWTAGTASYFGTVLSSGWTIDSAAVGALHERLGASGDTCTAADRLGERLAIVRLMSASGPRFRDLRRCAAASLRMMSSQNR